MSGQATRAGRCWKRHRCWCTGRVITKLSCIGSGELPLALTAENRAEATPASSTLSTLPATTGEILELRAATSLARLWQHEGKRAEAHALLAPIYGWFTEGFDTADLQEAKALLEALA